MFLLCKRGYFFFSVILQDGFIIIHFIGCITGYYKDAISNSSCTKCPDFSHTEGNTSTTRNDCKCTFSNRNELNDNIHDLNNFDIDPNDYIFEYSSQKCFRKYKIK